MENLILFLVTFSIAYLFYIIFVVTRKKNKKFNPKKLKMEEIYLISKYNLNMKKINYKKFLLLIYFCNSIIMGLTVVIIGIFDRIFYQLLVAPVILIPLILLTYSLIGNYYVKKGYVKNV